MTDNWVDRPRKLPNTPGIQFGVKDKRHKTRPEDRKPRKPKPWTYFYLDGKLYKKLHVDRGGNTITAWCYPDHRRVALVYSDVRIRRRTAFTTKEAARFVGRSYLTLSAAIGEGKVPVPERPYNIETGIVHPGARYLWDEKHIMALRDYYASVHIGTPRKDGLITSVGVPSAQETLAMVRNEPVIYVMENDEFRPAWVAQEF